MPDPCDPTVLHARVSVLESDNTRHEKDIGELWNRVSNLDVCAASLPGIGESLKTLTNDVKELKACTIRAESEKNGEKIAFLNIREWTIVVFMLSGMILEYLIFRWSL